MIQVSFSLLALVSGALADTGAPAQGVHFQADAERALGELATRCAAEGGRIWGRSLCGATLVVDPKSRAFVASVLAGGQLERGELDPAVPLANTAVEWRGRRWAMALWPLPADKGARERLLLHESWHRLQPDLNLSSHDLPRDHLDTVDGRTSLRLELRALTSALTAANSPGLRRAACRSVAIRAARYRAFPAAQAGEAALERNEGLAEYTGWAAAGRIDTAELSSTIARREAEPSHGRSFAYLTGPAYGVLLDRLRPGWRSPLDAESDLGSMLAGALPSTCRSERAAAAALRALGEAEVRAEENAIAVRRDAQVSAWRAALVDGPGIALSMEDAQIVFDPGNVFALPPHGSVYPKASVTAPWGRLTVANGALLATDWKTITISGGAVVQDGRRASGAGWTIDFAPGWKLGLNGKKEWTLIHGESAEPLQARQ